jgi:excinuclease ABC subunit B
MAAAEDEEAEPISITRDMSNKELERLIKELEAQMKQAAANLEFEKAALLRDQVFEMREVLVLRQTGRRDVPIWEQDRVLPVADIEPGDG